MLSSTMIKLAKLKFSHIARKHYLIQMLFIPTKNLNKIENTLSRQKVTFLKVIHFWNFLKILYIWIYTVRAEKLHIFGNFAELKMCHFSARQCIQIWLQRQLIVIKKTVIDSMIVAILIHKVSYLITLAIIIEMFTDCFWTRRIWTWEIWFDSYDSREEDIFSLESVLT